MRPRHYCKEYAGNVFLSYCIGVLSPAADAWRRLYKARLEQREHRLHRGELSSVDELQAVRRPRAADGAQGEPKGLDDAACAADRR